MSDEARSRLAEDMSRWIREYHDAGESDETIAAEMGVSLERVRDALAGEQEGWLSARGALSEVWDGEPAEDAIRRLRDSW